MLEEPFCNHCGYTLTGATESSKCPECGKPLVEVLQRRNAPVAGKRFTSTTRVFGIPLLQIALGPTGRERQGTAKAIIAIGDKAFGVVAGGGIACGLFAFGGLAFGGFCFGGVTAGVATLGGVAIALLAVGGVAVGLLGGGGVSIAYVVYSAGVGIAQYGRGGLILAAHGISGRGISPEGQRFFSDYAWLLGRDPFGIQLLLWAFAAMVLVAALTFLVLLAGYLLSRRTAAAEEG